MATIYYTASTLDGFIADAEGSLGWLFGHDRDETTAQSYDAFYARVGAVCMGRTTFDWVVRQHPELASEGIYDVPQWVLTHRPMEQPPRTTAFAGDVADLHPLLVEAADGRDVWIVGGGEVVGEFVDRGLLDEVWVQVAPVVVGAGAPLLPRRLDLELIAADHNRDFADLRYRVRR